MNFERFLNTLAYWYLVHDWFRDEVNAAGIKWAEMPRKFFGVDTVLLYEAKLRNMSPERALHEVKDFISLLENTSDDLSSIPNNSQVLKEHFQELYDEYQIQELAEKISRNPSEGKHLLDEFQIKSASQIDYYHISDVAKIKILEHLENAKNGKSIIEIPGYELISQMIGGFNHGRTAMFSGETGLGKTNFAINLALRAQSKMNVAFVNMEMTLEDMVKRFAIIGGRISYSNFSLGNYHADSIINSLASSKIALTCGTSLSFNQIRSWIKLLSRETPINLLIIDYDQKINLELTRGEEEWRGLHRVMKQFEDLAKEMSLYCLVLAQVNREGEISGSHRSKFSADTVLSFKRDEVHGYLISASKNRHGKRNQAVIVNYDESCTAIDEVDLITLEPAIKGPARHELKPFVQNTYQPVLQVHK